MRRIAIGTIDLFMTHIKMAIVIQGVKPVSDETTMYCIFAGKNVSIKVEVDPRHPEMLPDCCLLGAAHGW